MSDKDSRLPPRAEALIVAFPTPDRDFDALAARIDTAVQATAIGSTPDALLEAPLPNEPDEDLTPPPPVVSPRLSDLARAVAQKKGDAADAELARETLTVATKLRAQTDVLIERMRAAPRAVEPPLRPNPAPQPAAVAPARTDEPVPQPAAVAPARAAEPRSELGASTARQKSPARSLVWGGAGLSMAAAVALLVFGRQSQEPPGIPATAPASSTAAESAPRLTAGADTRAVLPAPQGVTAPEPGAAAPPETALTTPEPQAVALGRKAGGAAAKARGVDAEKVLLDEAPASAGPRLAKPTARPPAAQREAQAAPAEQPAAPAQDAAMKPAAGRTDDGLLPDRPSTGAVQAAIASVMNAARACVAGSTETTQVTVVFSANGSVKSVVVGGAVHGTPAGKCIQSALGNAKVAPFAQPAFSVNVSVRP